MSTAQKTAKPQKVMKTVNATAKRKSPAKAAPKVKPAVKASAKRKSPVHRLKSALSGGVAPLPVVTENTPHQQAWFADPFGGCQHKLEVPAGLTIAEMVQYVLTDQDVPAETEPLIRVYANGNEIPRANWKAMVPDAGTSLSLVATPLGGGTGKKVLSAIAMIAVVVLSVWSGGAASGALASAGYGSTTSAVGGALVASGVSMVGGLALSAIFGDDSSGTVHYTFNGVGNKTLTKNEPVPVILGTRRVYPKLAATTWTEAHDIDDDGDYYTYLNLILFWSYGRGSYTDLKIGESAITAFEDYTVEDHLSPDDDMPSLCDKIWPREDSISTELRHSYGWVTRRTRTKTTKIGVVLSWPNGLYGLNGKHSYPVKFAMQYRAVGDDDWIDAPTGGTFTVKKKVKHVFFKNYAWSVDEGQYDVRIKRTNKDDWSLSTTNYGKRQTTAYWLYMHSYGTKKPLLNADNFAFSTLRIKATNQVNGTLDNVNAIYSSIVPKWSGTEFDEDDYDVSRNPAELFHWYTTSDVTAQSQDGNTDDDDLGAWAEECDTNGWYCDYVVESGSMAKVMEILSASGQGFGSVWLDGNLSVSVDDARDTPVQLFSARNVRNFKGNINFPDEIHGVNVVYDDNSLSYQSQTITIYADGYDEDTATKFETINCPYKTDYSEAYIVGWRYLASRSLRPETYTFDTWTEGIAVRYGDRADVAHWAMSVGIQGSRIKSLVLDDDDNVSGVVINDDVTMETGTSYVLQMQRGTSSGTFNITTVAGTTNTLTLETAVAQDEFGIAGNPVVFGVAEKVTVPTIVMGIEIKDDKSATLTCIPYAEGMQENGGTIPDWDAEITSRASYSATCGSRALASADADAANDNQLSVVLANQAETAGQSDDISDAISSLEGLTDTVELQDLAALVTGDSLAAMVAEADAQEQTSETLQASEAKVSAQISQVKTVAASASEAVADISTDVDAEFESVSSEFTEEIESLSEDVSSVTSDLKTLSSTVDDNYSTLEAALQTVSDDQETYATNLATETSERESEDTTLSSSISEEAQTRADADTTQAANLTTETSEREDADTTITASVTEEATTRASADSSLSSKYTSLAATVGNISASGYLSATAEVDSSAGSVTVTLAALLSTSSTSTISALQLYVDSDDNSYLDVYAGRLRVINPDTDDVALMLKSDGTINTTDLLSSNAISATGYESFVSGSDNFGGLTIDSLPDTDETLVSLTKGKCWIVGFMDISDASNDDDYDSDTDTDSVTTKPSRIFADVYGHMPTSGSEGLQVWVMYGDSYIEDSDGNCYLDDPTPITRKYLSFKVGGDFGDGAQARIPKGNKYVQVVMRNQGSALKLYHVNMDYLRLKA